MQVDKDLDIIKDQRHVYSLQPKLSYFTYHTILSHLCHITLSQYYHIYVTFLCHDIITFMSKYGDKYKFWKKTNYSS